MSPNRSRASWRLALSLAALLATAPLAHATLVFDNFDAGDTFSPTANFGAAYAQRMFGSVVALRAAAEFTMAGGDFTLDSVTLPIASQNTVAGSFLRVRLTSDAAGVPGTTLEVLSENQGVWPSLTNPFTTKTTLPSSVHPLLANGSSYWIVTELTSIPAGDPLTVDYRWFDNTSGVTVPAWQQQAVGGLPSDPWSGSNSPLPLAFRVDGANTVGVGPITPLRTTLAIPRPTPFQSSAAVEYGLAHSGSVELAIFGLDGRRVRTLERSAREAGMHRIVWDGRDDGGREAPAGIYLARLITAEGRFDRRLIRLR